MRTSWTGGQYSLLRVLLAAVCAYRLGVFQPNALVLLVGQPLPANLPADPQSRSARLDLMARAVDLAAGLTIGSRRRGKRR